MQGPKEAQKTESGPADCYLSELHSQLKKLVDSRPGYKSPVQEDEAEDPKVYFIFLRYVLHMRKVVFFESAKQ